MSNDMAGGFPNQYWKEYIFVGSTPPHTDEFPEPAPCAMIGTANKRGSLYVYGPLKVQELASLDETLEVTSATHFQHGLSVGGTLTVGGTNIVDTLNAKAAKTGSSIEDFAARKLTVASTLTVEGDVIVAAERVVKVGDTDLAKGLTDLAARIDSLKATDIGAVPVSGGTITGNVTVTAG